MARQIRQTRTARPREPQAEDHRTPSGRPLPS